MARSKSIVLATAAIGFIIACLTLGPAAHFNQARAQSNNQGLTVNLDQAIFPAVKIIDFNGSVARLDTQTGAIFRFAGDLSGPDASGTWRLFARPLTQSTSGFLQVQEAGNGTFLVDVQNGDTWILRKRGSVASWILIPTLGG